MAGMIMEVAYMDILPGHEEGFEEAFAQAKDVVARAPGFRVIHLHRGVERPGTYLVAIGWDTVEDHMEGFRNSDLFTQWRALLGPHFAGTPTVEHWRLFDE